MTDIKRETKLTFPIITICSVGDTQDMIIDCTYGRYAYSDCNIKNLTLYVCDGFQENCVQLNYNLNKSELYQVYGVANLKGYSILFYQPVDPWITFAVTDNSDRVVFEEVNEIVYPGQDTHIALAKTVQTSLGPPYSSCNESQGYRQVNCNEDCINKVMTGKCYCRYPGECGR